jgi:hypothetical protein
MFLITVLGLVWFVAIAVLMAVFGIPLTFESMFGFLLFGALVCFGGAAVIEEFFPGAATREEPSQTPRDITQAFKKEAR